MGYQMGWLSLKPIVASRAVGSHVFTTAVIASLGRVRFPPCIAIGRSTPEEGPDWFVHCLLDDGVSVTIKAPVKLVRRSGKTLSPDRGWGDELC